VKKPLIILLAVSALLIIIALCLWLWPLVPAFFDSPFWVQVLDFMKGLGAGSIPAFLAIQVIQMVVAVIPGEPIEIAAGLLYGTWGGLALCMLGSLLGSALIFFGVRKLGHKAVDKLYKKEQSSKYKFLFRSDRLNVLAFMLFLIPGTPKDILLYLFPLTPVKPGAFFLITTLARIPSIISSTYAGANLARENWEISLLVFAVTGLLGLLGIILYNHWLKRKSAEAA
jgi:uncharacterized membrane protein YdjX (TVP38/TMEM64 family)